MMRTITIRTAAMLAFLATGPALAGAQVPPPQIGVPPDVGAPQTPPPTGTLIPLGGFRAPTEGPATFCGQSVPPPANLPPAGSGPVVWLIGPCFSA